MALSGNNNNGMYTILQDATNMMLGENAIENISLADIVDTGKTWTQVQKEQWFSELSARYIKTYYTDTNYNDKSNDVFFEDSASFGAITQIINIEMPDIIENRSWINVQSGTTTIGSNTIYLPIVREKLFASSDSWGVPITFTGTQLNEAFNSEQQLLEFESYVRLVTQNAIKYHRAIMNGVNRNNYIAEKIHVGNSAGKINVVNLIEEYQRDHGNSSMTVAQFFSNPDAMRYSIKTFKKYKALLQDMTTLFTTDTNSKGKFVSPDRFVFQVLSDFEGRIDSEVYSTTYHNDFVQLPLYRTVNAWQGLTGDTVSADFETMSTIDVVTADGSTVKQSGIIGLMVDKWAIMHTMVQNRVGRQRDDIKDITLYDYQFTDRYVNNLTLPGVIFTVQNYTA